LSDVCAPTSRKDRTPRKFCRQCLCSLSLTFFGLFPVLFLSGRRERMETEFPSDSLASLCTLSRKRAYDLYLANGFFEEEKEALKIKLAAKVNDEYFHVKNLPPPARPTSQPKSDSEIPRIKSSIENLLEEAAEMGGKKSQPTGNTRQINSNTDFIEEAEKKNLSLIEYQPTKVGDRTLPPSQAKV
jgi:hypothetical protein